ncbi:hemagglutinin repeat-containing protein [Dialister invisus]|uniref:hemagglutinin repeat-containing protein n=1 Tax=Dialister invisus TaxID=218538 RepID=UPI0039A02FAD
MGSIDNAARDIAAPVKRAGEVGDGRLKALYALQAGMNARDIQKNQKTDKAINKNNAVGINISLGSTGWKDHAETITEETKGSRITAGRTAAVIAKEDMTVKGSTVNAQDIHLTAGNNIHILSSENKSTTIEDYKAKSGSIGASISKGGYGIGASYGKGKGQTEETTLTHTPSDITAKDTVSLSSGNDTLIRGGTVKGNKVTANAGRMSIESEQDKKNYKETSKTSGLSISYTPGSAVTVSGGKGKTNTDSTYESVTKQAGIYAGKEGYDIQVKNNTRLKGAVIDSKAPAEKNKLTTGTLTWENIDNKAEYKTKASGITVSTNAVSKLNPLGLGYVPTVPVKGKAGSTTYAAIADSIITTTKEKTDKEISHDTTNALNTLSEIFDKKKIEEKQEYVNILSQVGYRLIGDIAGHKENELYKKAEKARKENNSILAEKYEKEAKKWSESGTNRIAMHGIMGALVSKEAGAGITKGLTGAGLNALLQKELGKIKDKEVHKIASAAIGYLAGGKTGAAIAHQATTFNYLTHEQYEQYLDDMKNAKTEEDKAKMKDRWLQIDAEQNEEWLRKQGTGTYIDLSTIKKGDMPGQVILEKHNRYKEALNKAALDKSKEIEEYLKLKGQPVTEETIEALKSTFIELASANRDADAIIITGSAGVGAGIEMGVIYDLKNSNGSGTYISGGGNVGLSMMPLNFTMAAIRIVPLDDKMRMDLQKPNTRKDILSGLSIGGTLYVGVGGGFMVPFDSEYKDRVRVYVMGIGTPQGGGDASIAQSLKDRADAMQSEIKDGSIIVD